MAVGNTTKIVDTKQIEFATAMKKKLREEKGSKLIEFAEKATIKGASSYVFYRMGESTASAGELNMFSDTYVGTGGEAKKTTAVISYVYAHDKIKAEQLNETSLDLEGTFIGSLSDALKRNVDKRILDAISAVGFNAVVGTEEDGKCVLVGDATKALEDAATVDAIIETAAFLATLAKETSVEGTDVAIVLDAEEFARLHRAEKFTNNNYGMMNKLVGDNTLLGCEVIKVAKSVKGKGILLVARGSFGCVSWENDVDAKAWWEDAQDALFTMCKRSLGVAVLDEKAIYKVQYKV